MGRFRRGDTRSLRICAAALLLLGSGTALASEEIDASNLERNFRNALSLTDIVYAPSPPRTPDSSYTGDFRTRARLTGDWLGARSNLANTGVTFFGDLTQYYQGVAAGGLARQFESGDRGDYLLDLDSEKMGLWEGGRFDFRGETRLGTDCNGIDGSFAPSNFAMALPLPNRNLTTLTGLQYTQDFSENVSVFFGKLNLLDGTPAAYTRGLRLNYFMNAAMQSNLSRSYLIPSTLGAGFTIRDEGEPAFNFYLLDTHYTPTTSGLSNLFSNGVVLYGEYRKRTDWFDLPGHNAVGFLYSTATRTSLDTDPYLVLDTVLSGGALPTENSAWTVTYRFDQVIYADPENPKRNWTLNSDVGLTDGNPNPIRWFANLTLVGTSPLRARENDTFGLGYYHLGVSQLPILKIHGIGAEDGVEFFYNTSVTPWFHVTPDLQILDPAQSHNATALVVGLRARLSF